MNDLERAQSPSSFRTLQRKTSRGLVGLLLGASCIATAPIFVVLAHDWAVLSPTLTAMWRTALSFPILLALLLWRERSRTSPVPTTAARVTGAQVTAAPVGGARGPLGPVLWLIVPGAFFAGDLASWHASMTSISAGSATFLSNLAAVIVPVFAWLWLGERPGKPFFVGALLALLGAALLVTNPGQRVLDTLPSGGAGYALGNLLAIVSAFCYSGYQLASRRALTVASTLRVMVWTTGICGASLALFALPTEQAWLPHSARGWVPLLGLAVFGQILGQGLIVWSMRFVSASVVSVVLLWQPVASSILAYLVLGQRVGELQAVGMASVFFGLVVVALRGAMPARRR